MTVPITEVEEWFKKKNYICYFERDGCYCFKRDQPRFMPYMIQTDNGCLATPLWRAYQQLVLQNEEFGN